MRSCLSWRTQYRFQLQRNVNGSPFEPLADESCHMTPLTVRVVYVVPKDAEPWGEAKQRAMDLLEDLQWYFADQLHRNNYEPRKTFEIARDQDDDLSFRQVHAPQTKVEFPNRDRALAICKDLLGPPDQAYAEICFVEAYRITAGLVSNDLAGTSKRRSCITSLDLKVALREWVADTNKYGHQVFSWISSEPIKHWKGRGEQVGDLSGAGFAVIAHELSHSFGLKHLEKDDPRRKEEKEGKGYLMGNQFRGMRGNFRPDLTNDFCDITKEEAEILSSGGFFDVRKLRPRSLSFGPRAGSM